MGATIHKPIRFLFIILLTAFSYSVKAQSVINLDSVDVIKIEGGKGPLSFYQKKNNEYREITVDFNLDPEKKKISYKILEEAKSYQDIFKGNDQAIAVTDLKSYSPGALFRMLSKYQFKATEKGKEYTSYYYMQLFNPYKALITEVETDYAQEKAAGNDEEEDADHYYLSDFIVVQLRPDKCIAIYYDNAYYFYQDKMGFFVPAKGRDYLFVDEFPFEQEKIVKQKTDNSWKNDDRKIKKIIKDNRFQSFYYVDETDDGKQILTDNFGTRLLPGVYDKISRTNYFILAAEGKSLTVYNLFLEPLIKDIRSYTLNKYFPEVINILNGNKVCAIDFRGVVDPQKKYLPTLPTSYQPYYSYGYVSRDVREDKKENAFYLYSHFSYRGRSESFTQRNRIILPDAVSLGDVQFLYHTADTPSVKEEQWMIIRRNNYFGLFAITLPMEQIDSKTLEEDGNRHKRDTIYTGTPVQCKELLPIVLDSISRLDDNGYLKLLIYKNHLKGIYPIDTVPKYKFIKQIKGATFLRFELSDGRKGWLNLQTKEEFPDITQVH